jgi:broad specificity phosphatase PhoE
VSKNTNIFLVRHGQTEWNEQNRLQGQKNSPLTKIGKQQAFKVKESLDQHDIHKAYVSPLQRAQDTLDIILEGREIEVIKSDNLKEINLGPWEGKTMEETEQSHPIEFNRFWKNQDKFALPGAETFDQLQSRVVAGLNAIFAKEKSGNVLVVSHWIAIKVALAHYTSTPLQQLSNISNPKNGTFLTLTNRCNDISIHGV